MTPKKATMTESKADQTTAAARKIVDAEKLAQDTKTLRLRKARLAKEATIVPAPPNRLEGDVREAITAELSRRR
jgi:hypothetical protein